MIEFKEQIRKKMVVFYCEIKKYICKLIYPQLSIGEDSKIKGRSKIDRKAIVTIGNRMAVTQSLSIQGSRKVLFASNCHIQNLKANGCGEAIIEENCSFNIRQIDSFKLMKIGNNSMLFNCYIVNTDFHDIESQLRRGSPGEKASAPIEIESNVWIGGEAVVMKGVRVGANSVVGLGTVVRENVPVNVVVIGNPQQVVKRLLPDREEFHS